MTDNQVYSIVRQALFETGSCYYNTWYTIVVNNRPVFEAAINNKGFIHIRKPIRKVEYKENTFLYQKWRFNSKKELIDDGLWEGTKPEKENIKKVKL
jgi:hypothetical protein